MLVRSGAISAVRCPRQGLFFGCAERFSWDHRPGWNLLCRVRQPRGTFRSVSSIRSSRPAGCQRVSAGPPDRNHGWNGTSSLICCCSCSTGSVACPRTDCKSCQVITSCDHAIAQFHRPSRAGNVNSERTDHAHFRGVRMTKVIDKSVSPRHPLSTVPSDVARQTDRQSSSYH